MAWVVFDRAVKLAEGFELDGACGKLEADARRDPRAGVRAGYDPERRTFTQYYGSQELDAPCSYTHGGIPAADDERVIGTVDAVQRELARDGLLSRYSTSQTDDGLPGTRDSFWPARSGSSARSR